VITESTLGKDGDVLVTVRYFAGAAAAAGVEDEKVEVKAGTTVAGLLRHLEGNRPALAPVLGVASVLLDEVPLRDRDLPLQESATVDVLPPFAGG
jgi:molybdopterin synthase sulfur carrier subunit